MIDRKEPAAVAVPHGTLPSLDVDLNGQADALSDGIVIIRHLFGFSGSALVDGAVDPAGQRTDPTAIQNYLNSVQSALDVDLNQQADALSDGIVIIRNLFGFTGTALTDGAIDPGGSRTDPAAIAAVLDNLNPQRELVAPLVTAGLLQDTGASATDGITSNPAITGTIADINPIVSFTAGFDVTPAANFVDILSDLQSDGTFTLSTARLSQLAGGTLVDGAHTMHLRVTDARGNVSSPVDVSFTYDTVKPADPNFSLTPATDSTPLEDHRTTFALVNLAGQTEPGARVVLANQGLITITDGTGLFQLSGVPLTLGPNELVVQASDMAGNVSVASRTITRDPAEGGVFESQIMATGFDLPTAMTFLPDGRLLVVELGGIVKVVSVPYTGQDPTPFLELTNVGSAGGQQGVYDIALDPNFSSNHYYYLFYTAGTPNRDRLSRFTANESLTGTVPGSELILYEDPQNAGVEHHGGAINFGNDGKLYFTTGEHFDAARSQDLSSPRGKLHRINLDGTVTSVVNSGRHELQPHAADC